MASLPFHIPFRPRKFLRRVIGARVQSSIFDFIFILYVTSRQVTSRHVTLHYVTHSIINCYTYLSGTDLLSMFFEYVECHRNVRLHVLLAAYLRGLQVHAQQGHVHLSIKGNSCQGNSKERSQVSFVATLACAFDFFVIVQGLFVKEVPYLLTSLLRPPPFTLPLCKHKDITKTLLIARYIVLNTKPVVF